MAIKVHFIVTVLMARREEVIPLCGGLGYNGAMGKKVIIQDENRHEKMNISVSGVCERNGKKAAYVMVEDNGRTMEAVIPDCEIISNQGFSEAEKDQFRDYLKQELPTLQKAASGINVMDAFMDRK